MARKAVLKCDICNRETNLIVGKLTYIEIIPGVSRGTHSNYSHHLDVGTCCKEKLFKAWNFRKRMTADQYRESRKAAGAASG